MRHQPVLLAAVVRALDQEPGARIIDGTVGEGGHAVALLAALDGKAELLGIDLDPVALAAARARLVGAKKVTLIQGNFRDIKKIVAANGFENATAILLDLGIRSAEIEESGLGFSFLRDEPLAMRFDGKVEPPTAASLLAGLSERELTRIFRDYGEEPFAARIAAAIVQTRRRGPIRRTAELVELIASAIPARARHGRIHFATRVFQALRIAVNDELASLKDALPDAFSLLAPGGTLGVISFHSLEDRIVKNAFRQLAKGAGELPFKKPIIAAPEEVAANPRSRSAKLRVVKRKI